MRALAKNARFVRQAQAIRKGKPDAIVVLSMVGENYRLTKDMKTAAMELKLSLASTALVLRQPHADAPGQSTFVWQMGVPGSTCRARNRPVNFVRFCQKLWPRMLSPSANNAPVQWDRRGEAWQTDDRSRQDSRLFHRTLTLRRSARFLLKSLSPAGHRTLTTPRLVRMQERRNPASQPQGRDGQKRGRSQLA